MLSGDRKKMIDSAFLELLIEFWREMTGIRKDHGEQNGGDIRTEKRQETIPDPVVERLEPGEEKSGRMNRMADPETIPGRQNAFEQQGTKGASEQVRPFPCVRIGRQRDRSGKAVSRTKAPGNPCHRNAQSYGQATGSIQFGSHFDPPDLPSRLGVRRQTSPEAPLSLPGRGNTPQETCGKNPPEESRDRPRQREPSFPEKREDGPRDPHRHKRRRKKRKDPERGEPEKEPPSLFHISGRSVGQGQIS